MTHQTEGESMDEGAQVQYEAFTAFLRALTEARTVAEVNVAAGVLLQQLGEEPSLPEEAS